MIKLYTYRLNVMSTWSGSAALKRKDEEFNEAAQLVQTRERLFTLQLNLKLYRTLIKAKVYVSKLLQTSDSLTVKRKLNSHYY